MALDFPASPSVNQKYPQPPVAGVPVYSWDGEKWRIADLSGKTPIYTDGSTAMAAQLTLVSPPLNPTDATSKAYVDGNDAIATAAEYLSNSAPTKRLTSGAIWTAAQNNTNVAATSFTPDLGASIDFLWTLNGPNCQLNNPANLKNGQKGLILLLQDGTGGRLITTWGTAYKFPSLTKPTLTTSAGSLDVISYYAAGSAAAPVMYCFFSPQMG
jgi:hypothetical protein